MGILNERNIEISTSEYKEFLEKEIRLDLVVEKIKKDKYVSAEALLSIAGASSVKEEEE